MAAGHIGKARLGIESVNVSRKGKGQPLVLLHCLGVDRRIWDFTGLDEIDGLELISYDFPGHGDVAAPTASYAIEDLADQLLALLDWLELDEVSLCGISLGGLVAQCFAARYPTRTRKIILVDTTPRYTDDLRQAWVERAAVARTRGVSAMAPHLMQIWFTPDIVAAQAAPVRYVSSCFAVASGEGYALACEALGRADLRDSLGKIRAPTLVVCGNEDLPSFLDAANEMATRIPHASLTWLSPARHASMLEQPEAFAGAVRAFMNDVA